MVVEVKKRVKRNPKKYFFGYFFGYLFRNTLIIKVESGEGGF